LGSFKALMEFNLYFALAALAAVLIGMSKGGLPIVGMMSVPLLSLFMSPLKAAVLLLPLFVISDAVGLWLYRRNYSLINLKILIPAGVAGVFLGWLTASMIDESTIKLIIGLVGVSFCLQTLFKRSDSAELATASIPKGSFWGLISGFTSFIAHAGGPPFQIFMVPQKFPKAEFAGTSTIFFAIVNLSKVIPYQDLSPYSLDDLQQAAYLVPCALIGTFLGAYLTRRIADAWFYKLVLSGLFLVSLKLIWSALSA
jgi:uncharacterized membrane protein YfcA